MFFSLIYIYNDNFFQLTHANSMNFNSLLWLKIYHLPNIFAEGSISLGSL